MTNLHTIDELRERQALPLDVKVAMTEVRLHEWQYNGNFGVETGVVSFSGGKDSTVLLHIARKLYPNIPAVFSNTGLEYPEIQKFVKQFDNVKIIQPKMRFNEVISKYGYPLISKEVAEAIYYARRLKTTATTMRKRAELRGESGSGVGNDRLLQFSKRKYLPLARDIPVPISHYCCQVMKKAPLHAFQKQSGLHPILATMAEESRVRRQAWLRTGCNAFDSNTPKSQPMSFWTEQDVLRYIVENRIEIASVYGDIVFVDDDGNEYDALSTMHDGCKLKCTGCQRTGCVYCAFGAHLDKGETRFQRLARTHPRHYEYCIGGGQWVENPAYDPVAPRFDGEWENWNPKKIWVPSKKGLGLGEVFRMVNEIYGKQFYRWE